jgi:hypothetical protein
MRSVSLGARGRVRMRGESRLPEARAIPIRISAAFVPSRIPTGVFGGRQREKR